MSVEAFLKGWVSRMLPQAEQDNDGGLVRLGRFGDVWTIGAVRKQHALADEGSYFVANTGNPATGVATAAAPTAFSDTAPMLTFYNQDSAGNQNSKRLHLDFIRLTVTAAGTAGVSFRAGIKIGTGSAYASGGTSLTPTAVNMDVPARASIAHVAILPVAVAMTAPRVVVGDVYAIPTLAAVWPVGASVLFNFGGVETSGHGSIYASSTATMLTNTVNLPPVVIGPGQSAVLLHLLTSQSAASSWSAEIGWWER